MPHWDGFNTRILKWFEFLGVFWGRIVVYARPFEMAAQTADFFRFFDDTLVYVASMYFLVSPNTAIERFYLP